MAKNAPELGVVGRPATRSVFDLDRWAPSDESAEWVEHFWSVDWDLSGQPSSANTVITFPAMHLTHEWGTDSPRHGHPLPNTLVHGVVERVFRHYVGVPVKWVLCRYRLQHAALEIETDSSVDFADLAVRLGWYDQAHFINDFRSMLGCTPGEYATRHG